jgi:hypothetical protein
MFSAKPPFKEFSPELAAPWAEALPDPNTCFNRMENFVRHWFNTDRLGAEVWLARIILPDNRIQRLLRRAYAASAATTSLVHLIDHPRS